MNLRVEYIFNKEFKNDTSFTEKPTGLELLFGTSKFTQQEVRDVWRRGIKLGIEVGLLYSDPQGQRIEMKENTNEKHKEFLEKMYNLCNQYKCSIEYHPEMGMVVLDKSFNEI